jgi:phosphoribosylglycinamide formyltransferase-1
MVHRVPDEGVDDGPVLASIEVPIHLDDTFESLQARIHAAEHKLLVKSIRDLLHRSDGPPESSESSESSDTPTHDANPHDTKATSA